jgi:hypothetical protein
MSSTVTTSSEHLACPSQYDVFSIFSPVLIHNI